MAFHPIKGDLTINPYSFSYQDSIWDKFDYSAYFFIKKLFY